MKARLVFKIVNAKLENGWVDIIATFTFMKKDIQKNQNNLIDNIKEIIFAARKSVAINVNNELITAYWNVGRIIIENEKVNNIDNSSSRQLILELSKRLTEEIGKGFSRSNLFNMRKFYLEYPDVQTLSGQLTWSHICELGMAGFVRIRQVESRSKLSFSRALRFSSDRHGLMPPPLWAS